MAPLETPMQTDQLTEVAQAVRGATLPPEDAVGADDGARVADDTEKVGCRRHLSGAFPLCCRARMS